MNAGKAVHNYHAKHVDKIELAEFDEHPKRSMALSQVLVEDPLPNGPYEILEFNIRPSLSDRRRVSWTYALSLLPFLKAQGSQSR
jgi:hypothetical protein